MLPAPIRDLAPGGAAVRSAPASSTSETRVLRPGFGLSVISSSACTLLEANTGMLIFVQVEVF